MLLRCPPPPAERRGGVSAGLVRVVGTWAGTSRKHRPRNGGTWMALFTDLLGSLAAPPVGRSRRISSNEQPNWNDGNMDMTRLAPGQVFEFPELQGPGVIKHIWFTSHAGGANELDSASLRIYWDGRPGPAVGVPGRRVVCRGR